MNAGNEQGPRTILILIKLELSHQVPHMGRFVSAAQYTHYSKTPYFVQNIRLINFLSQNMLTK